MTAIAEADRHSRLGEATFVVAGGMESMTNAPYVLPTGRYGARMGDTTMIDSMTHDGLWCAFDHCTMGESSDLKNVKLGIGRDEQDAWSAESHARAAEASDSGVLDGEIDPDLGFGGCPAGSVLLDTSIVRDRPWHRGINRGQDSPSKPQGPGPAGSRRR